jgi:lysophospholipase L1-like esterase
VRTERRRFVVLAAASAVAALAALAPGAEATTPSASAQVAGTYVALGDSYTAGPLLPLIDQPYGCLRSSTLNYPHLVADRLGIAVRDVSCSGAETEDMFAPQGVTPGPNPPQLDALDAGVGLVTLQIGGNDIGFSGIAEDCVSLDPTGHPCQDRFVVDGVDEISRRIAETEPLVAAVLATIHDRAPAARVLVVPYIDILPAALPQLCWPQLPIAYADVPYLRAKEQELDAMLARVAAANGAEYVDAYTPSVGHDACQPPGLRWVEPLVPANLAAPIHPNALGMLGVADAVVAQLQGG